MGEARGASRRGRRPLRRLGAERTRRSASSATSTTGAPPPIRCTRSPRPASGRASSTEPRPGSTTSTTSTAARRPTRSRSRRRCRRRRRRSSTRRRTCGRTTTGSRSAGRASSSSGRSRSTRCMRRRGAAGLGWRELADELAPYVKDLGFTHVELMPVMHHPFSGSWGYQVTGYYAPLVVDGLARRLPLLRRPPAPGGIGVILDWVPAHFPRDEWALARFDGTALYEHDDPRRGAHPDWGTLVFNLGRTEVQNFLLANALFWLREYHADGLRVDAVASMLYLDYSRKAGRVAAERVRRPREPRGGRVPEGAERARARARARRDLGRRGVDRVAGRLAADVHRRARLRLQMEHGLDARHARLLRARSDPPPLPPPRADVLARLRVERELHPAAVARRGRAREGIAARRRCRATAGSSSRTCARSTRTCGRTRARSCSSWAASSPRRGSGPRPTELPWWLLEHAEHAGVRDLVRDLNRVYRDEPALWEVDFSHEGFAWLEPNDASNNVLAFMRVSRDGASRLVCVANLVAGAARGLPGRTAAGRRVGGGAEHRLRVLRRHRASATSARSRRADAAGTTSRTRPR